MSADMAIEKDMVEYIKINKYINTNIYKCLYIYTYTKNTKDIRIQFCKTLSKTFYYTVFLFPFKTYYIFFSPTNSFLLFNNRTKINFYLTIYLFNN